MAKQETVPGPTATRAKTEPAPGTPPREKAPATPARERRRPEPFGPSSPGAGGDGGNGNGTGYGRGGDGPDFEGGREGLPAPLAKVGLGVILGPMAILFSALVSAYVVRMGLGGWDSVAVGSFPSLWVSTALLVLASLALVRAGRRSRRGALDGARSDVLVALGLGTAFLASQATAWLALRDAGIFVATNPASSFIYLLTGIHALHILGGLGALAWVLFRRSRAPREAAALGMAGAGATGGTLSGGVSGAAPAHGRSSPATPSVAMEVSGLYWHFLLAVWLVFFALMLVT